ncbi:L-threonylcarbamoyladenylate synthase [Sphingomonas sp. TZW2008]|uniref:L-threonylcarbamoyladenylate synthase n=1 Tax=Sphingomonas sp. TZW2008 TaxID=1917973 RepID=UPI000A2708B1|nr:L-threonylcarbamoyladenylate synthase [Sphingomonas sp. TZW2008]
MTAQLPRIVPFGDDAVAAAVAVLRVGAIVALPTETVYGLAADATHGAAVASIYGAKGRPSFNPLIVHVADLAAAERIALFDEEARGLAARWWPGPLTLVLPLRGEAGIAGLVTAGLETIAIRVPAHRAMQAVLRAFGGPLAAPSANVSNAISPTRAAHVAASLGARVPLILDDGPTSAGVESTIIGWGAAGAAILRPGPITAEDLGLPLAAGEARINAPGQLATHYAPHKPLRLHAITREAGEWLIGFGAVTGDDTLSASGDLLEAAARLFDALHRADAAPAERIAVAPVPATGIGAAINDRLRRAAHR